MIILSKKNIRNPDLFLIVWLIISCLNIVYYLYPSATPSILQSFGFTLPVLSTGILFLYVTSLTSVHEFKADLILKNILPYFAYNTLFQLVSLIFGKIQFIHSIPNLRLATHPAILMTLTIPMAIVPVIYILVCYFALKKYQRILPEYYSSLEKINLNWLKYTLFSFIGLFIIIYGIILISTKSDFIPIYKTFKIIAAIQSAFLFFICFFSLRQSIINNYIVTPELQTNIRYRNLKPDEKLNEKTQMVLEFMKHEKPYLIEDISLPKLAKDLHISTNILSQIINQNLNTNFYKFINSYRIEEVKKMLKDPSFIHYSILGIAYEAGFNSKSTFNKIFKEETGMTPSEFRKS